MNCPISIRFVLSVALLGTSFSGVAESLDAALDAQKKKNARRVYSERAHLTDLNIVAPKTVSEEEKALDRDLRRLENELDRQVAPTRGMTVPRQTAPVASKPKNWLTPEFLDTDDDPLADEEEPSWIVRELERQDAIRLQKSAIEKETAQLEKQLREDVRQADPYHSVSSPSLSPINPNPASQYNVRTPSGNFLSTERGVTPEKSPSLLSPARRDSGVINSSFSSRKHFSSQPTSVQQEFNRPVQKVNGLFSPNRTKKKEKPLSPLKRVRQSSPIYRKDPFADDFMPEIKTSIWD